MNDQDWYTHEDQPDQPPNDGSGWYPDSYEPHPSPEQPRRAWTVATGCLVLSMVCLVGMIALSIAGGWLFLYPRWELRQYLFPVAENNKWGYIDRNGDPKIAQYFDYAGEFHDSMGVIRIGNKWGYVDPFEKFRIDPAYDAALPFSEGLAAVKQYGKWGYVDKYGKMVIPPWLDFGTPFSEGLAAVKVGAKWGFIDKEGKLAIKSQYDYVGKFSQGYAAVIFFPKMGYIDKYGNMAINPSYEPYVNIRDFPPKENNNDKKIYNWLIYQQLGYEGIFAVEGAPEYDDMSAWAALNVSAFSEDRSLARNADNKLLGYISYDNILNRDFVIPSQFEDAFPFSQGFAAVKMNNKKWGFIDKTGLLVIDAVFDDALSFSEGKAGVKVEKKWGYIDTDGNFAIAPYFDFVLKYYNGLAWVEKDNVRGYIRDNGDYAWPSSLRNLPRPTMVVTIENTSFPEMPGTPFSLTNPAKPTTIPGNSPSPNNTATLTVTPNFGNLHPPIREDLPTQTQTPTLTSLPTQSPTAGTPALDVPPAEPGNPVLQDTSGVPTAAFLPTYTSAPALTASAPTPGPQPQ